MPKQIFTITFGLFTSLALLACSSSSPLTPQDEAKELKPKEQISAEQTDAELFMKAKRLYSAKMYSIASDSFDMLIKSYPSSPYVLFSELKIADSKFLIKDYQEASKRYEEFAKNHPTSDDSTYAKLQAARSYLLSSRGGGRNRVPIEKAIELCSSIINDKQAPSIAESAINLRYEAVEKLTEYDRVVMDYYEGTGNTEAVNAREKEIQEKWGAILNVKPKDTLSKEALTPLKATSKKVVFNVEKEESQEKAVSEPESKKSAVLIRSIKCWRREIPFIAIELSRDDPSLPDDEVLTPENGALTLKIPDGFSKPTVANCMTRGDISISRDGVVKLKTDDDYLLTTLENPVRLLLIRNQEKI